MSRPLTVIEGIDYVEEKHNFTITNDEIVSMHRREYEKLMSKNKEELVRMIMGDNAYFDAVAQKIETSNHCFHAKEITEENIDYEDMRIECYDCHTVINFHEDDIIDGYYVVCPDCGQHLVILE